MGCEVYANGMTIACKVADGKTVAAMPDVCLSPPSPPAGPVPIPYPNTAMASDTTEGSKTVQIGGQEVMLKNKSYFKQSNGDEAATKSLGMGVVTHQIQGKVNFVNWSMDVKFEGENIPRHLDLTGHNEASDPPNTPPWPYADSMARGGADPCEKEKDREEKACKEYAPNKPGGRDACAESGLGKGQKPAGGYDVAFAMPSGTTENSQEALGAAHRADADECLRARRCKLQPYSPNKCCGGQTGHHLIEASALHDVGRGKPKTSKSGVVTPSIPLKGVSNYKEGEAPCICAEGVNQNTGTHGILHSFQSAENASAPVEVLEFANGAKQSEKVVTYAQAKENACQAVHKAFPYNGCSSECIKHQLDHYHNKCGINDSTKIKAVEEGKTDAAALEHAAADAEERAGGYLGDRFSEGSVIEGDYSWMD